MSIDTPEQRTSTLVICKPCGTSNSPQRHFCGSCGQALWEICAACQERTSAGEAYCGGCGESLVESLASLTAQLEQAVVEAERLALEFLFDAAIKQLAPVIQATHPRVKPLADRARQQRERLLLEQAEQEQDAQSALLAARSHLEGNDFRRALQALKGVPEPLRGEEHLELLTELRIKEEDCRALLQQIRTALEKKENDKLYSLVEQYLLLDALHPEVNKLAEKLRQRQQRDALQQRESLLDSSRASLARHEYQSALDQLHKIPASARNENFEKLLEQATELAYLATSLRDAPHVDPLLVSIAQRLLKLQPNDTHAAAKLEEARQRLHDTPRDPRGALPEWAPAPQRTAIGLPVDWLGGFARLAPADAELRAKLVEHPGLFCVAAGLALQGLQRGRLGINLMPVEKEGLLERLGKVGRTRPVTAAWGLDLGATALKVVKLAISEAGRLTIEACEVIPYEKALGRPDAQGHTGELVLAALKEFLKLHQPDAKTQRVAISMPGGRALGRFMKVPRVKQQKVAELMQYEAAHQIPLPLDSIYWGYQMLEGMEQDAAEAPMVDCVLLAAQRGDVEQRLGWCQAAGIAVDIVQSECVALYNLAHAEFFDPAAPLIPEDDEAQVMLVDIGGDNTNILVAGRRSLWFRTVGKGTDEFTRRLIRNFNLTYDKAEPLKQNPALARQMSKVYEALEPALADFEKELRMTLTAFGTHQGSLEDETAQPPARVFLCGGGAQTHGLLRYLRLGK